MQKTKENIHNNTACKVLSQFGVVFLFKRICKHCMNGGVNQGAFKTFYTSFCHRLFGLFLINSLRPSQQFFSHIRTVSNWVNRG